MGAVLLGMQAIAGDAGVALTVDDEDALAAINYMAQVRHAARLQRGLCRMRPAFVILCLKASHAILNGFLFPRSRRCMQGDASLYTPEMLAARHALRHEQAVSCLAGCAQRARCNMESTVAQMATGS